MQMHNLHCIFSKCLICYAKNANADFASVCTMYMNLNMNMYMYLSTVVYRVCAQASARKRAALLKKKHFRNFHKKL